MKNRYGIGALLIVLILSTFVFGETVTKGLIGKEDLSLHATDNGATQTFTRPTSTGSTLTLTKLAANDLLWRNTYERTIRPLHIVGDGSTSTLSGFSSLSATTGTLTNITSSGTAALGTVTASGTLGVTGTGTFSGSLVSNSLTSGAATLSSIALSGNLVGSTSTISGLAQLQVDDKKIDTGTAKPTSGTWAVGDFVRNSAPTVDTTIAITAAVGWYCYSAGTPGSWHTIYRPFKVAPASAAAFGEPGMIAYDNTAIYVAIADNTWMKAAIATW